MIQSISLRFMLLGFLLPLVANAEWTGKGEAGAVMARGNTVTDTANAKIDFATQHEQWKHAFGIAGIYAASEDDTGQKRATAQRWDVHQQTDYQYSKRSFWFEALRYERDRFSGFVFQSSLSLGAGRKFIDNERTHWSGQIGVGYGISETRDSFAADGVTLLKMGEREREVVGIAGLDFKQALTATTTLLNKLNVESGSSNTQAQNDLSLQVKINATLALALGYTVHYNSKPAVEFKETDTFTTINLVYEFK